VNLPPGSEGESMGASDTGRGRDLNERIRDVAGDAELPTAGSRRYLCECNEQDCLETVELTADEYQEVCADLTLALVTPGHEAADDRVVRRTGRFSLVANATAGSREPSPANLEAVLEDLRLRAEEIRHELADQAEQTSRRRANGWPKDGL
jgi:hypothetical protein